MWSRFLLKTEYNLVQVMYVEKEKKDVFVLDTLIFLSLHSIISGRRLRFLCTRDLPCVASCIIHSRFADFFVVLRTHCTNVEKV